MGNDTEILDINGEETPQQEFKTESKIELKEQPNYSEESGHNFKSKKNNSLRIIGIVILILAILLILIETFVGVIDVGQIKDNKQPMWYLNSDIERTKNKQITTYDLGLYVIEKIESKTEIKIILKPFFIK